MVVLLLMALGYGYIAQDEAAVTERERAKAVAAQETVTETLDGQVAELASRSKILGFTTDVTVPSNVESATAALAELKDAFPDMEPVKTYQDAVPAVIKAYQAKLAQIGTLQAQVTELEGKVNAERSSLSDLETEKDNRIAELETQLSDLRDTSSSEIARLESSVSDLRGQVTSSTDRITELTDTIRQGERTLDETVLASTSTRLGYTKRLQDITRRAEKADGEILAVAEQFNTAYINVKAGDRLSEGTVFRIVSGKPGADESKAKAYCRVVNAGPERSEVRIYDVADRFQPVVTGDKIYNPLFEAKGERNAVLAGSMSGSYNEPELRLLFAEIGINIQNEVSNTTDFLIAGGPLFVDEEGEPFEDGPMQVDQLPIYGEARDQGVTIVPIRDVYQYFSR